MRNFLVLLSVSAIALTVAVPAKAEDAAATSEKREEHYEHVKIESTEQAKDVMTDVIAKSREVLKKTSLEFLDSEELHKFSYSMEASVDRLRADKAGDAAKLDSLDEAVQAFHFASENQDEVKVREWFDKLATAFEGLNTADAAAQAAPEKKDHYDIVIKDHKFTPAELVVPADVKIKLIVDNQDATPEEFESHDFNREKIIAGNTKATIFIGPLKAGTYKYFGEFNMDTAQGVIIAK